MEGVVLSSKRRGHLTISGFTAIFRAVRAGEIGAQRLVSQHQEAGLLCRAMDGSRRPRFFENSVGLKSQGNVICWRCLV